MPRGLPDYYNPDTLVSQRLANVEELLTLMRGVASIDNRGRTFYYSNFGEGIRSWRLKNFFDGSLPVCSALQAEVDPASMEMDAGTLSGSGENYAEKRFRIHDLKKAGLEFSLAHYNDSAKVAGILAYDNGTNYVQGRIDIDQVAKTVEIYDDDTPVTVVTLPASYAQIDWLPVKVVFDFENGIYLRLLVGLRQYDLTKYSLSLGGTVQEGVFITHIKGIAVDDGDNIAYIGHVAITVDEP